MASLSERIANLPPEKRALLERKLIENKESRETRARAGRDSIPRRDRSRPCPLSFAQQRLWFLHQMEPDSPVYNVPNVTRLRGELDVEALRRALDALIARHEALRATFRTVDGSPAQVISDPCSVDLKTLDLADLQPEAREAALQRALRAEVHRPFDLTADLLLRAALARLAPGEHLLLLVVHHVACDAWSIEILTQELATLYAAFHEGVAPRLPDLPIQYPDFAAWQREWFAREAQAKQLAYWESHLSGSLPPLEVPSDHPRPAVQTYRGARRAVELPSELVGAVQELGRREGVTPFVALLAAFQALLYRYTGQDDVVLGSLIAGRTRVETERLVGFFVNTVVLRTALSGDPTFRALLGRTREVVLGAHAAQDTPFEKLVERLQPARSLSHSPLFQVMFQLKNVPRASASWPGLDAERCDYDPGIAKFDLSLELTKSLELNKHDERISGHLEYNTDLYEPASADRLIRHYLALLQAGVADPERRLSELPLLADVERDTILVKWNATAADYPRGERIHTLFEAQAARAPGAIAATLGSRALTYGELNTRANQLARHLRRRGIGPGSVVGVCLPPSPETLVALLGVLKAGGAYVPLDPSYPAERLALIARDTGMPAALTLRGLEGKLAGHETHVVRLDADWPEIAQESSDGLPGPSAGDDVAYVIYTSGSTGVPKGVLGTHRGAVNRFTWMWKAYPFAGDEVCCQKTALSFVDSVWEIFGPLLKGVPTVVVPEDVAKDPQRLVELLAERRVTRIVLVPSLLRAILATCADLDRKLPHLRLWVSSGEALSAELCRRFYRALPGRVLLNLYGSSEVAADATWFDTRDLEPGATTVPIGRPIANTQVYVLDTHLHPVPVGLTGEIYVAGDGLARGYLRRPDLTAERFLPHPFEASAHPEARVYRTGDLGRYRPDGNVEFLGRADHQVKVRGYRVELGEVEATLRQCPGVRECAVIAPDEGDGERRLVAYVAPSGSRPLPAAELRAFLAARLPEHMLPAAFVSLEALPLTVSGKLDRKALPAPDEGRSDRSSTYEPPRDDLERRLVAIWEETLGVKPVGRRDDFFELGGHSLLAVRLFARIEQAFGRRLPLATLFESATVEHLSRALRGEGESREWTSLVAIQAGEARPPFFCVHALGGHVLVYRNLARPLGPDQPVYALQAQALDGRSRPSARIEEMAATYLEEVRAFQPTGPYYLGGLSLGGVVAFEMAQQLVARGHAVALLALLDSRCPSGDRRSLSEALLYRIYHLMQRIDFHRGNLSTLGAREWMEYLLDRLAIARDRTRALAAGASREATSPEGLGADGSSARRSATGELRLVRAANLRARLAYQARPYPGRVALFRASAQPFGLGGSADLGWGSVALGGVEVHEVPGYHASIVVEPHVRVLAGQLRECLRRAQRSGGPA